MFLCAQIVLHWHRFMMPQKCVTLVFTQCNGRITVTYFVREIDSRLILHDCDLAVNLNISLT